MVSIALCDDHQIVRTGIRQLLEAKPEFSVIAEVSSGESLLEKMRQNQPKVVILDIGLPGRNGIDVLKQLHLLYPAVKVLVLSMYPEDQYAIRAIKAGASGYLHKDSPPEVLYDAIFTIAGGNRHVSARTANLLFNEISAPRIHPLHKALSDRELEVAMLLGQGKKVTEIAQNIALSAKTVSTYKKRILEKLNILSVAELTQYLLQHKLLHKTSAVY